jgi:hypothetical protein
MGQSETLSWQSEVAELTAEKERAVIAAGIIKRLGGPGDVTAAEIAYGDGRAETEAVIAALIIALEQGTGADDRADLDARIERATAARETLGRRAQDLAAGAGARGPALDLLTSALPALLSAVGALWTRRTDRDASSRAAIATRLDAARWPAFADLKG